MKMSKCTTAKWMMGFALAAMFGGGPAGGGSAAGLALIGFAFAPEIAHAEDAAAPVVLEPVVVQARRRDEKLLDAPVAVTMQTGEQLRDQNAVLFEDVARMAPNLRMMQSPQSVSALDVTMRGQTAIRASINYDAAVGIYVDGVYVANGQAAMGTLLDIDDVQVIRGAQGTQFGRNNTGGAILFKTKRPLLGVTTAEAAADTGADGLFMGRGILNLPLGNTAALRIAYQDNERNGYGSSVASGQNDFGNQHRYQARVGALWKPNGGFDAYLTYEHFEANEAGSLLHPLRGTLVEQLGQAIDQIRQGGPLPGIAPVMFPSSTYQTDANFLSHDRTKLDATQLTLTQALGEAARAKLTVAYRHLTNDTAIDVDASSLPFADTLISNTSSQKSAELQLSGLALDRRLNWVGGLYWFHDDGNAPSMIPAQSDAYQALFQSIGAPVVPFPVVESNSIRNESSAAFIHGEFRVTDRWAVAAGVRRTDDLRRLSENAYAATPGGPACTIVDASTGLPPGFPIPAPCPPIDKSVRFSYWSWELSTSYRLAGGLSTYFRTGRGQRSGGWNAPVNTFQDQPFHPEQLTDFEWGVKAQALGGAWVTMADVFYGDYQQMQRLMPSLVGGTPGRRQSLSPVGHPA
jgi:iron complex outermembrane receptor protein